jgi:thymidylate synthase (FAD)
MKLIKASYEVLTDINSSEILKRIEEAGRTCYKSEDKITDESAPKFNEMILSRGHESVIEHQSLSVRFICDRGVSHELVRHRLCSFSQESTRYCNYSKDKHDNQLTFIIPCWFKGANEKQIGREVGGPTWLIQMSDSESDYKFLLSECDWQPQQARSILPNSLKTEIVVTANLRQWREIFRQRTAKAAHPQMRELMRPLLDELKNSIPVIFDDITLK